MAKGQDDREKRRRARFNARIAEPDGLWAYGGIKAIMIVDAIENDSNLDWLLERLFGFAKVGSHRKY